MAIALGWIFNWCGVQIQHFSSVSNFINFAVNWGHSPKKRNIFIAIYYGLLWCSCKAKNEVVFNKVYISSLKMADSVVTMDKIAYSDGQTKPNRTEPMG
ncbi:hypothetical protein OSB04_024890 [Centaurea solstitialis]|uniref:Uncharacterized protein n=1 Tax=Centaurea solstitialis TaxID=347529 RepID=A0AA38T6G4_9ASTR|nr:hypothetical protein OSB04_024890 [Centaurea solstitialis]